MIPIRDINPRVRVPYFNYLLMAAVAAVFVLQLLSGSDDSLVRAFGFVPLELKRALDLGTSEAIGQVALTMFASAFLHGGWFHVAGNLLYLRVFGDNVEDRFGHFTFLLFFLGSAMIGSYAEYSFSPTSSVPIVGMSGAVSGVLGAYIVLFPRARVLTLFPIFILLTFLEVPALVFLGIWALQQFLNGYLSISESVHAGGVAWFAHLGGFGFGLTCGLVARLRKRTKPSQSA